MKSADFLRDRRVRRWFESYPRSLDDFSPSFWVYILENPAGRFYIGSTENLQRRVQQHNDQSADSAFKYTRARGPWALR